MAQEQGMEEAKERLFALELNFSRLSLQYRREAVELVKIGIGRCGSVYRKVAPHGSDFSSLSLFSLPQAETLEEVASDGGLQIELYSERPTLELVCAGYLESVPLSRCAAASAPPAWSKRICSPALESGVLPIALFFKANGAFTMHAGEICVKVRVHNISTENALRGGICSVCNFEEPPRHHMPPAQQAAPAKVQVELDDRELYESESESESESSVEAAQYESDGDNSVDRFVTGFLASPAAVAEPANAADPRTATVPISSATSIDRTRASQSSHLRRSSDSNRAQQLSSLNSKLQLQKKKKTPTASSQPRYLQPARAPPFQETLRKR